MSSNHKYLNQHDTHPYPHMGELLRRRIRLSGQTHAAISRKLGIAQTGTARYLEQSSLQAGILWKIGLIINHNFLAELGAAFPVPLPDADTAHREAVAANEQRIAELQKELAIYKEIVMGRK